MTEEIGTDNEKSLQNAYTRVVQDCISRWGARFLLKRNRSNYGF